MDYNKLYNKIIEVHGTNDKPKDWYTERHHIIPKSVGGLDDSANLVYLSARVHFICHRILCKLYPESDKLKFAFWAMCNQLNGDVTRNYKITSKVFEQARQAFAEANSRRHKGKKMSKEWCEALSKRMKGNTINPKGEDNPLYGVPRTEEVKEKMRQTLRAKYEQNPQFKGYYVTPKGKFMSATVAAEETGYPVGLVRKYCKNPDKIVTERMLTKTSPLTSCTVGKPLQELGWDFELK